MILNGKTYRHWESPLAAALRDLRVQLGIDLRSAAKLCCLDIVELSRIERSEFKPGEYDVYAFARHVRALLRPGRERQNARARRFRAKISKMLEAK